jgi:NAD(P)-dependent dehydrogenase (short-subunit alcohol dehydrogenase family)
MAALARQAVLLRVSAWPRPIRTRPKGTHDMADMSGQVALVTGGVRGIGLAIGRRLHVRGVTVAAGYSRGKKAAGSLREEHPGASTHQGNIGVNEDCERVMGEVLEAHCRLDILVNNAGITIDKSLRWRADPTSAALVWQLEAG